MSHLTSLHKLMLILNFQPGICSAHLILFTGTRIFDPATITFCLRLIISAGLPALVNMNSMQHIAQQQLLVEVKLPVTAILRPRLGTNEIKFVQDLLMKNIKGKPEEAHGITDLIAVPMSQAPEISFSNLGQFGIESEEYSISIRAIRFNGCNLHFLHNK